MSLNQQLSLPLTNEEYEMSNITTNNHPILTKMDFLYRLRRCSNIDTLEKVVEYKERTLSGVALSLLYSAADHRRVEIISGKLFDKVPAKAWKLLL